MSLLLSREAIKAIGQLDCPVDPQLNALLKKAEESYGMTLDDWSSAYVSFPINPLLPEFFFSYSFGT